MNNEENEVIDVTSNVTSDQINSATKLVATYSIIIKSDTVLQQVIENLELGMTYSELNSRVSVQAVDDTQVMKITVNSTSPEWAQTVCDEILAVSPDIIKEAVEAGSVKVISKASLNLNPISPNIKKNTALHWRWVLLCYRFCWTIRSTRRKMLPSIWI